MTDFKLKQEILRAKICWASWCFASWSPTRALPWTYWGVYSALQTSCWFLNVFSERKGLWPLTNSIWNTKTVLEQSAWKNPCQDILLFCIFNHPMVWQIRDIMISISTWDRVHFWIYLLNHNLLSHQTWLIDRYKQGQQF